MRIAVGPCDAGPMPMRLLCRWIRLTRMSSSIHPVTRRLPIRTDYLLKIAIWRCVHAFPLVDRDRVPMLINDNDWFSNRTFVRITVIAA